jgi:hypothetical protein
MPGHVNGIVVTPFHEDLRFPNDRVQDTATYRIQGFGSGLDPDSIGRDWIRIRIGDQTKMLDPDPYKMNADP